MFCTFFIGSVGVNLLNFRIRFYIFENIIQDIKFYSKQNYEKSDAAEIINRFLKNVSSKKRVKPWFFVTFNIVLRHIFPENFIEFLQVVQKILRNSLSIL